MKKIILAVAVLFTLNIAQAQQTIRQTSKQQKNRIKQGVRSGELTKAETRNLVKDQREIRNDIKDAKSDGTITKAERKEIKQEQRKANREIARKKHNNRDRN